MKYTLLDYCKEAFYYQFHHIYFDESIQILDRNFSYDDFLLMVDYYLNNSCSREERKIYRKIENIKKMKQFAIVMKKHGDSLDYTADYLMNRKITLKMVNSIFTKIEEVQEYMPEEWHYLNSLLTVMEEKSNKKKLADGARKEQVKNIQTQNRNKKVQMIKSVVEDFLSEKNYIPIFQYYCALNYLSLTTVNKALPLLKTAYPDLYNRFLEKDSKKDSIEYKDQLSVVLDNTFLLLSNATYQAYTQNREPDLVDYYKTVPFSFYGLIKVVNQLCTKNENEIVRNFYHDLRYFPHFFEYEKYIAETLSSMSDSYSEEEEKEVCQKLEKIGFPVLSIDRFNHTGIPFSDNKEVVTKVYFK